MISPRDIETDIKATHVQRNIRMYLSPPTGMLRSKLEALQCFMRESHTGTPKGKDDDSQSAAPIYALLAMSKVRVEGVE